MDTLEGCLGHACLLDQRAGSAFGTHAVFEFDMKTQQCLVTLPDGHDSNFDFAESEGIVSELASAFPQTYSAQQFFLYRSLSTSAVLAMEV